MSAAVPTTRVPGSSPARPPASPGAEAGRRTRPAPPPIPFSRLVDVELRKMFDTRAGFWLLVSIAVLATVATVSVVLFAPDAMQTYESFGTAVGVPMSVILPMIAILAVTGEWSQRSGLTTFTLVPARGRVVLAKFVSTVGVGIVAVLLAMLIGAGGNLLGALANGVDPVWNLSVTDTALIVLANVLNVLVGFMLGVLLRSSAAGIVAYFVWSFVLPAAFGALAAFQEWFRELQGWVDLSYAQGALFGGQVTGEQWAHLGVTSLVWLVLPLAVGLVLLRRSEVK